MTADDTLRKAKSEIKKRDNQELSAAIKDAIIQGLVPQFTELKAVLRKRLELVEGAISGLELVAPDKVEVANSLSIKDTVQIRGMVTDPQVAELLSELQSLNQKLTSGNKETIKTLAQIVNKNSLAISNDVTVAHLKEYIAELVNSIENLTESEVKIRLLTNSEATPTQYLPVRLTDGERFIRSLGGGGGGNPFIKARLWNGTDYSGNVELTAVESTDVAGVYGLVVLNADGSMISGTPAASYEVLMEDGASALMMENSNAIAGEAA